VGESDTILIYGGIRVKEQGQVGLLPKCYRVTINHNDSEKTTVKEEFILDISEGHTLDRFYYP
jgi:hypothetical protein